MSAKEEKRQFIRLDTVFPIEFQVIDTDDRRPLSDLYEGFTRNIGKGGMGIFAKTLKRKDEEFFQFVPHATKLKVIINIPLDKEPIESLATVEWIEKKPGPLVDTYMFGISYDFINEFEYEKIVSYVKWLRLKPKLIATAITLLLIAFIVSLAFLLKINEKKVENEKRLVQSLAETKEARDARTQAEDDMSSMESELETATRRKMALQIAFANLAERKRALEEMSVTSEEEKRGLEIQIEELADEKARLEDMTGQEAELAEIETAEEESAAGVSEERMEAEKPNYNKFRELILNEKVQSLSAYVSTHRSSVYHAAALFALAELRYKHGEKTLAVVSYNEVIEIYPRSEYALYSSHRLEQLGKNYNYDQYTLKYFYDTYNLPELFDYRNIAPYIR